MELINPALQRQVHDWLLKCFGPELANDPGERNLRFLEEALELVQACGGSARQAHGIVDYVFSRPAGARQQELGGVLVTLAALAAIHRLDMNLCVKAELAEISERIAAIRVKRMSEPEF